MVICLSAIWLAEIHYYSGSDVLYMNVLGQPIVIIDKYEAAVEILDKRSGIYSSRYCHNTWSREGQG
jgi:hypothetical protein